MTISKILICAALLGLTIPGAVASAVPIKLWRLNCGAILLKDYGALSGDPTALHQSRQLTSSCYLISHGAEYMEWESGVDPAFIDHPDDKPVNRTTLERGQTLAEQFKVLKIDPSAVKYLGLSHLHTDHMGQAALFSTATLLMGARDLDTLRTGNPELRPELLAHWLKDGGKVIPLHGDYNVFGDGTVMLLETPGHTFGHYSLLVRLRSGPVLLSGDLWHFSADLASDRAASVESDPAALAASRERIRRLVASTGAKLIIQHDPADIGKLPAFPQAAE